MYEPALYVFSGGQATNTLLSGGVAMNVSSGGYVDGTLITSGECIVNSNTKYTSAKMWVAPGGSANRTVVYSGGEVLLAGNMTSSFVNGGSARVSAGGCFLLNLRWSCLCFIRRSCREQCCQWWGAVCCLWRQRHCNEGNFRFDFCISVCQRRFRIWHSD
ncbi:MAG: hypothetical protein V8T87_11220 [Victivallales bacterium]